MTVSIEPDFLIPKSKPIAARTERPDGKKDSAGDFAATLRRDAPASERSQSAGKTGKEVDDRKRDTPSNAIPYFIPAEEAPDGSADAADDNGILVSAPEADQLADAEIPLGDADAGDDAGSDETLDAAVPAADAGAGLQVPLASTDAASTADTDEVAPDAGSSAPGSTANGSASLPSVAAPPASGANVRADTDRPVRERPSASAPVAASPEPGGSRDRAALVQASIGAGTDLPARPATEIISPEAAADPASGADFQPDPADRGHRLDEAVPDESINAHGDGAELTGKAGTGPAAAAKTAGHTGPSPSSEPFLPASAQPVQAGAVQTSAQASAPVSMAPTHAIITAGPAETVQIISEAIASPDERQDRITVQLDPPELGRVSIDFRFDSHGLQHVTITGETPEALRQLRLMHFELTQALERGGLSSENMTFQQQQSGQQQANSAQAQGRFGSAAATDMSDLAAPQPAMLPPSPARTAGGGLDIRL